MSYEIHYDESTGILNARYSGIATLEERKKNIDEMSFLYSHLESLLLLVDVRELVVDLTLDEQKMFGKYCASLTKIAHARVAILHKKNHNPNFLVDAHVFINGGRQRAQFSNETDARNWLKDI